MSAPILQPSLKDAFILQAGWTGVFCDCPICKEGKN